MKILIGRGLPGTGKTTYFKRRFYLMGDKVEIFSADEFHTFDGVYKYDPKRAKYAHDCCFRAYMMAAVVEKKTEYLIVDNMNTTKVELAPYVRIAEALDIEYSILYFPCSIDTSMSRNVHDVPYLTIERMYNNLITESLPAWWKQEVILE